MAISSPITTDRITKSVKSFNKSIGNVKKTTSGIIQNLDGKVKRKKSLFSLENLVFFRKREASRRKKQEELAEASKGTSILTNPMAAIKNTAKGFMGRLLDFIGSLLLGWALNNLPTILFMIREFIARVNRVFSIGKAFIADIGSSLLGFGRLLGAVGKNIITLDFFDSERRVSSALSDLTNVFDDMKYQIEEGIKTVTTPLNINLETGEQAPDFGTQYPAQPQPGEGQITGGKFTGSGASKGAQIAKRLQSDLGITDFQAASIVGNLLQENTSLDPALLEGSKRGLLVEAMRKGIGYGWAQWTYPTRQRDLYNYAKSKGINPDTQPLTDEINYGFLVQELRAGFRNTLATKRTIEEASNFILLKYENPDDKGPTEQRQRIEDSKRVLGLMGSVRLEPNQSQQQILPGKPQNIPTLNLAQRYFKEQNVAGQIGRGIITSLYRSADRPSHNGVDIYVPTGTYIALKVDCEIIDYGNTNPTGYGNEMHIWVPQYSIRLKLAHLSGAIITSGKVPAGKSFARSGMTGRSTGPHIHLEAGPRNSYKGDRDPSPYVPLLWLTDGPNSPFARTAQAQQNVIPSQITAPARIASNQQPRMQQTQQLAQSSSSTRIGPTVIIAQQPPPPTQRKQSSNSGGGLIPIPIVSNTLNKYVNNKILLDLSYT